MAYKYKRLVSTCKKFPEEVSPGMITVTTSCKKNIKLITV